MATTKNAPTKAKTRKRKTAKRKTIAKQAAPKRSPRKATKPAKAPGRKPDAGSKSGNIRELLKTGMKAADIAKKVGCTVGLVYNVRGRAASKTKKRGPGRPRKALTAPTDLAAIIEAVRASDRETEAMRVALERIQAAIVNALG